MSTANKNYPLIKETDSNGQPLNAYDQLVTESNNFRRAVDNDINEVENKVSSLEQKVITESGSNENGRYIRFSDGTQLSWLSRSDIGYETVNERTNEYRTDTITLTFASSFIEAPTIIHTTAPGSWGDTRTVSGGHPTTTSVPLLGLGASSKSLVRFCYLAIGRWK